MFGRARAEKLGASLPAPRASARPSLSGVPLGFRIADAFLAVGVFLLVELLAVGIARHRELAGAFEMVRALALWPIAWVLAAPFALLAGGLVELARAGDHPRARLSLGAVAGAFSGAVAYGVSGGRNLAEGLRRPLFVTGLATAAALAAYAISPLVARAIRSSRAERWWRIPACALGVFAALELANAMVLPRLYPAMHAGLAVLALVTAGAAAAPLLELDATRRSQARYSARAVRAASALALLGLSAALAPVAARVLAPSDNVRLIYATHAPLLSHAVVAAATIEAPPPLADGDLASSPEGPRAVDLEGRDVVIITVDALRADHVGAYGYGRPTTPRLDALAAESALFERAYTAAPHTSYAVTSLMTGKYMRPLLLQDLGADSETLPLHLRRYGYKTAAFYPPAIFFIDGDRFGALRDRGLDFEYARAEFMPASGRVAQVKTYLSTLRPDDRAFLWVHLFEPHEPYVRHEGRDFGDRDVDRYDSEIAEADAAIGEIVDLVRARSPGAVVIVSADHGEEFLDHGGRYHGTTVYEEQVRVPLIVSAPGRIPPRRVTQPVQLVDVLPTLLSSLAIPRPARVRGRDLGPLLAGAEVPPDLASGFAFAETDTQTLVAKGPLRLVCERRVGACALYDIERDPAQRYDLSATRKAELELLRAELRAFEASHGRFEVRGLRKEGKGWPEALRRGIAGDGDAAQDVGALLDDADVAIRRKAGEVLFDLRRPESASFLRLAVVRDEDDEVRRWCALTLTRLGEGAARARELLRDGEPRWRRLAALALAETGDDRGEDTLVAWLRAGYARDVKQDARELVPYERAVEIVGALGKTKTKTAVVPMLDALDDVRLRPHLARALAAIGDDAARGALAARLATEPHETTRVAIAEALVKLGAGPELQLPLVRLLGAPDPLPNGLRIAELADVLNYVGGPKKTDLMRLRRFATSGVAIPLVAPKPPKGEPDLGVRIICRAHSTDALAGEIRVGRRTLRSALKAKRDKSSFVPSRAPELDPDRSLGIAVTPSKQPVEVFAQLPEALGVDPGDYVELVIYATQNVALESCALVPRTREPPPPPPKPWSPAKDSGARD